MRGVKVREGVKMRKIPVAFIAGWFAVTVFAVPVEARTAPSVSPSFNCARASEVAEKLICNNRELAMLDRQIATAFAQALARVDAKAGAALRKEQAIFINVRNAMARPDYKFDPSPAPQRLRVIMTDRRSFLQSVRKPPSRTILSGQWRNYFASLSLKAWPPRHFKIAGSGADPLAARWLCEVDGIAGSRGGTLVMDERGSDGSELSFVRDGDMLKITERLAKGSAVTTYCGHNGSFEGQYFYTGA